MPKKPEPYLQSSQESTPNSQVTELPDSGLDLEKFRDSKEAAKLVAWVQEEWNKAKQNRSQKQMQWYQNMSMFYGQQWVEQTRSAFPSQFRGLQRESYLHRCASPRYFRDEVLPHP